MRGAGKKGAYDDTENDSIIHDWEKMVEANGRVILRFKKEIENTLSQIQSSFKWTMAMYLITFAIGVILIFSSLYMAFLPGTPNPSLFSVLFAGVGVIDILAVFISDPPARIKDSRIDYAQLMSPYYVWFIEIVNRHDLLDRYRTQMINFYTKKPETSPRNFPGEKADDSGIRETAPVRPDPGSSLPGGPAEPVFPSDPDYLKQKQIWLDIFEMESAQARLILEDTRMCMKMIEEYTGHPFSPVPSPGEDPGQDQGETPGENVGGTDLKSPDKKGLGQALSDGLKRVTGSVVKRD
ncbi:MAG: hypothetical protein LUO97_02270 [Methanomicrobiales archaeon]|nr:hypothetical protein [Methanomicrobiales archaeon]